MNSQSVHPDHEGTIQGDHQRLKAKLARLHEQLVSACLTPAQTDREFSQVEAEMDEHFGREESGFFAEILELAPELNERVLNLLREHKELRQVFRALRKTCRWACGESGMRAGWLAEFAEFHQRFNEHEQAEHELLHESLQRDLGAGD